MKNTCQRRKHAGLIIARAAMDGDIRVADGRVLPEACDYFGLQKITEDVTYVPEEI